MAYYTIKFRVEGSRIEGIKKKVAATFGEKVAAQITKDTSVSSRQDRLNAVQSVIEEAASDIEELRDELQEWYDNLPEQFQSGDKGSELEDAIQSLDTLKDELEVVNFSDVSFPSMY